jgi:hypothetical protein
MSKINSRVDDNLRAESFAAYNDDSQVLAVNKVAITFTVEQWEYLVRTYMECRDQGQPTLGVEICAGNRNPPTSDPRPGASIKIFVSDGGEFAPIEIPGAK